MAVSTSDQLLNEKRKYGKVDNQFLAGQGQHWVETGITVVSEANRSVPEK